MIKQGRERETSANRSGAGKSMSPADAMLQVILLSEGVVNLEGVVSATSAKKRRPVQD
jgi:hypothetical protein